MTKSSVVTAVAVSTLLIFSASAAFAQSPGGAANGPSAGTGNPVGSPNAGSAGANTTGASGVPSGPANAGGLNNSGNDGSGGGNSVKLASPPPGTNSAGTANASGSSANSAAGVTTGTAGSRTDSDAAIDAEDKQIDRRLKSICRGC